MALSRWEPTGHELRHLRHTLDRMFEDPFFLAPMTMMGEDIRILPIDMYETPDQVVIRTTVAGVKPEDVDITVSGNTVTIRAERKETKEAEGEPVRTERFYGRFERMITLPMPVEADKAQATFQNGELTLRLPKAEEAKAKHIKVQAA